jgi:hypothetical protein
MSVDSWTQWTRTVDSLPRENVVVLTKIDDVHGLRNEARLKRRGNLWFLPDDSMYVYYTPTHWTDVTTEAAPLR